MLDFLLSCGAYLLMPAPCRPMKRRPSFSSTLDHTAPTMINTALYHEISVAQVIDSGWHDGANGNRMSSEITNSGT